MKFTSFLNENKYSDDYNDFHSDNIIQQSEKFLKQSDGQCLWRGTYGDFSYSNDFIKNRRNGRLPKDTHLLLHKFLDVQFQKVFGWKARSDGVFAFGDFGQATTFGKPYPMFPIGDFNYLWSKKIIDLTDHLANYFNIVVTKYDGDKKKIQELITDHEKELISFVHMYTNKHFQDYLDTYFDHEIMIDCDKYFLTTPEIAHLVREKWSKR